MKYKVVCTDIDGTLLDSRRELSAKTIAIFKNLPPEVMVVLASSRMPAAMRHLQEQLGVLHHPMICYNGGFLIQYREASPVPEVLDTVTMPLEICAGIIALTRDTTIHTSLYFEDEWYAPVWDQWSEREARITKAEPVVMSLENVLAKWSENRNGAHKVMCMGDEKEIELMEAGLKKSFSEDIHIYRSRPTYLELAPRAISKGSALELLLKRKNHSSLAEVIAFGDNYNDIELLRVAGHGVAVANGREEVKAVAAEITADSKLDGVALVLEEHFST
jgi:Cof subfamily protein (haloacid dehalogenase superfamily)